MLLFFSNFLLLIFLFRLGSLIILFLLDIKNENIFRYNSKFAFAPILALRSFVIYVAIIYKNKCQPSVIVMNPTGGNDVSMFSKVTHFQNMFANLFFFSSKNMIGEIGILQCRGDGVDIDIDIDIMLPHGVEMTTVSLSQKVQSIYDLKSSGILKEKRRKKKSSGAMDGPLGST